MLDQMPQGLNPLSPSQAQQFTDLLGGMTPVQQAWVSGWLAASATLAGGAAAPAPVAAVESTPLTILYGSQTGNARHVASDMAEAAKARGLDVKLVNMADYKPNQLKSEKFLTIVVSTYGEGEPPEPAEKLFAFLGSKKAPKMESAKVAVLGIGDSSYEFFCQTAVDFEDRFRALGADVVVERAMFDVDYDDHAAGWIGGALDVFEPDLKASGAAPSNVVPMPGLAAPVSQFTKKNPFLAEVAAVQKITGRDSTRDVRHVEISLEGSGLTYQPGDALGVYFHNDAGEVDAVLARLDLDGDAVITLSDRELSLRTALIEEMELTQAYPGFVEKYGNATGDAELIALAEDKVLLRDFIEPRQIYDILRAHPHKVEPQALVDALRKMQPRLYSIASSQAEVEDEVHLTVGVVEWDAFDHGHLGGCSGHLGRRAEEGDRLRVYVESNDGFRLPADPTTPVIMIGPGTGIAPFRAFLQEREAQGAEGQSWLFFGNPHFTQDFLYQVELQSYLKDGVLTKLDVAFSRDQAEKIYVQDRIRENGAELYQWLEGGAHLYICGDANRMAKDVHAALIDLYRTHGNLSAEAAEEALDTLRDAKRYQRDVY
ncbi:MAG: assimilatory sulfite reductase (NADPH) flavoprotein subunit [Silicimonas sp.]|nr:assimilatory sulfite reductase (NADPH) flavoprotein subunit [Silicimonas sp.]